VKAIFTTAYGPHRIQATDGDGNTVRTDKDSACGVETHHDDAVRALCTKMNWHGTLAKAHVMRSGGNVGRVYVWASGTFAESITV
jgi:hypothetical protein